LNLSKYIAEDIKQRVLSGNSVPSKITIVVLAEEYEVSTRPVRIALDVLIDEEILIKSTTGRLSVNPDMIGASKKAQKINLPANHYKIILDDLIKLSFEINDDNYFVREEVLSEKHGISRTPVRIILQKISGTGLIEHKERIGWLLRPFRQEDFDQFNQMRVVLEVHALKLAKDNLDLKLIQEFLEGNFIEKNGTVHLNNKFHNYIIDMSKNRYLKDFFNRSQEYFKLFLADENNIELSKQACLLHQKILKNILKKNWVEAEKYLAKHITTSIPAPAINNKLI